MDGWLTGVILAIVVAMVIPGGQESVSRASWSRSWA